MAAAVGDYSEPPSPTSTPKSGPSVEETRLLQTMSDAAPRSAPSRVVSTASFVSSPLNPSSPTPSSPTSNPFSSARSRPVSRSSHLDLNSIHPRDSSYPAYGPPHLAFANALPGPTQRGSMILYRLAAEDEAATKSPSSSIRDSQLLLPPKFPGGSNRDSTASSSSSSFVSLDKFSSNNRDSAFPTIRGGLIPYEYDPAADLLDPIDDEDRLHDPKAHGIRENRFPWRGVLNVSVLILLVFGLLCLFVFYPVISFYKNDARNQRIDGNIRINATGQNPDLFQMPDLIDKETPDNAKSRRGFDGLDYELVFSDEFNTPGRTFYPGDDPYWEAVSLWYGATGDLEWYDPSQVTTRDGALVITMDATTTTTAGVTPNSTAPFTADTNHALNYRSGMLQSWNKFCFTTGYIEVSVILPGPDENTKGYWPGAWTMGNLARPGYPATTDGMWPYTYDSCDIGTFPNQTLKDKTGPAAALHSDSSREKYNYELSWQPGQRLSACSCPGSDHPGPVVSRGRGAPEIDVFEAEADKNAPTGHVVSQSAQFAPYSHDYLYLNDTEAQFKIFSPDLTRPNSYRGSAVQQAVSSLTRLPSDMFQGTGKTFRKLGFEYWSNPKNRDEGYVAWQVNGQQSYRVGATAVGADQGPDGSGVGPRIIPEEPMAIILNLGISPNWQPIDVSTMMFPSEFLIDYVRVYQRKGHTNVGCNPKDYPTADYIDNHKEAYQNPNVTVWQWPKPKNSMFDGPC